MLPMLVRCGCLVFRRIGVDFSNSRLKRFNGRWGDAQNSLLLRVPRVSRRFVYFRVGVILHAKLLHGP